MLLELDKSITVIGEAANGREAVEQARELNPDVVLMDINMPEMDGIQATELIGVSNPRTAVIIVSVQGEQEYLKRAMLAGAKEFLIKPFSPDELASTVKRVVELNRKRWESLGDIGSEGAEEVRAHQPHIVTVFSTKGGVGKTCICANLAVALAERTGEKVGLVDLDLQFGDIAVMLNIFPKRTIAELMQEQGDLDTELLQSYLYERNGVDVLASPNKPELAELIEADDVARVLKAFSKSHDYVIVDTPPVFNDTTLVALDVADIILLVASLDLPTVKNIKRSLDILTTLGLLHKVKLVLNRASHYHGIDPNDVEKVLEMKIDARLPNDGKLVVQSVNRGQPFILVDPNAPVTKALYSLVSVVDPGIDTRAHKPDAGFKEKPGLKEDRKRRFWGKKAATAR
jgi:pilus assembly protein CpaE